MPSPFPMESDENYDPNVDIDRIIEDKLFPPMTVKMPDDNNYGQWFWGLWETKEDTRPNWFWNPEDI